MHRNQLLQQLADYAQSTWIKHDYENQLAHLNNITSFINNHSNCFQRELLQGHLTGSSMLLNHCQDKFLLTHHKKLGIWIQLGGHADGNSDMLAVALQEAQEESGIEQIAPLSAKIFDIDVHQIPEHKGVPAHIHYDIRYLLQVLADVKFIVSEESIDLKWFELETAQQTLASSPSLLQMVIKLQDGIPGSSGQAGNTNRQDSRFGRA